MTIEQYIQDTYIGKMVKFLVREVKEEVDGLVTTQKQGALPNRWTIETEWECFDHHNNDWSHNSKYWMRDVYFVDKVISIKQVRNYWVFTTLKGYELSVTTTTELEII